MPSAVNSTFDVAFWFADAALNNNEYLQPQKMHRLLFLAQAYYGVAFGGRKLMPAVFVAEELGPVEPTIYRAFSKGRPNVDAEMFLAEDLEEFLQGIWRRFGNFTAERLSQITNETLAYRQALKKGKRAEISLEAMCRAFGAKGMPGVDQVVKAKVMRSQTGKPVAVRAWVPGVKN